ncbi:MAG: GUN4 domain-containing protein [Spirulina sp.]
MGKYALLIGVDTYGEGLQPLPAASKDVAALREVLLNPQMGGFDEAKPVINPTQPEMAREIELWFQDRQPEDLVLLFFSGHGVKDDRRDLYFAAANTEKQRDRLLTSTATSARFLHDRIRACKAKYQVLILDCCFSGAFGDLVGKDDGEIPLQEQLGAEGRVVLTSTSAVDYSFEEKGADLSIYTRYLVEGIATGAADEDGDGAITAEDLHRYAGRKVQEASPAMSPKIFIPQGEGYRIRLARSPQDDPRLKYRKEAERRATAAEFTIPAKRLLMGLRAELGLAEAEADAIEAEVLKPHRDYQRKRQDYHETLHQCLERESPLSPRTINDLMDYRAHLRLKPEDVATIEQAVLGGQDLEGYITVLERQRQSEAQQRKQEQADAERRQQAEAQRQREAAEQKRQAKSAAQRRQEDTERQIQVIWAKVKQLLTTNQTEQLAKPNQIQETNLNSEKGIDYTPLHDLLKAQDWRAADRETLEVMIRAAGPDKAKSGYGFAGDVLLNFPCTDLRTINYLWVKYSQGKFGFSVQKEIYVKCGAKLDGEMPDDEIIGKFFDHVGWYKGDKFLNYSDFKASLSLSPRGEFPFGYFVHSEEIVREFIESGRWTGWGYDPSIFSRIETCNRLA